LAIDIRTEASIALHGQPGTGTDCQLFTKRCIKAGEHLQVITVTAKLFYYVVQMATFYSVHFSANTMRLSFCRHYVNVKQGI